MTLIVPEELEKGEADAKEHPMEQTFERAGSLPHEHVQLASRMLQKNALCVVG